MTNPHPPPKANAANPAIAADAASAPRLHASEEFLDRVGRIASVGGWAVDLRSQVVTWSLQTRRMHEVDDARYPRWPRASISTRPRPGR